MPFSRPTLSQLRQQASADIAAALPGTDSLLRYSNLSILGDVEAAQTSGLYGYLDYIAKQAVPFTSTDEYLEGWSAFRSVIRKPATSAIGVAYFNGADENVVPAGTPVQSATGIAFVSTADAIVVDGYAAVPLSAVTPGIDGNVAAGTAFTLSAGISGVSSSGSATSAFTGGAEVEKDDALRTRMLFAWANPPQGGALGDYQRWALEVPGVTRAWVAPNRMGAGTVVVYTMFDDAEAADGGFPQGNAGCAALEDRDAPATGDLLAVANAIYPLRPVTALVYSVAPIANRLVFTIDGLAAASVVTRTAIAAAIRTILILQGSVGGARVADGSTGGVLRLSFIERAIAAIAGTDGFVITGITASAGTVAPGLAGNITSNAGALPVLDNIVFT